MKKNIVSILFIGFIAIISMSFQSSNVGGGNSSSGTITLLKGSLGNRDKHRNWKDVTFGLMGFNPNKDKVLFVEITDPTGHILGTVYNIDGFSGRHGIQNGDSEIDEYNGHRGNYNDDKDSNGTCWFKVDLDRVGVSVDFNLVVHIKSSKRSGSTASTLLSTTSTTTPPPPTTNDPDETILIVRYP